MRDLHNHLTPEPSVNPQTIAANATTKGAGVDLEGFLGAEVLFVSGTLTDGDYACKLQESDDDVDGDYTDVAAGDLIGAEPTFVPADGGKVKAVGYIGGKRWLRAVITSTNVTAGGVLAASVVKGYARHIGTTL